MSTAICSEFQVQILEDQIELTVAVETVHDFLKFDLNIISFLELTSRSFCSIKRSLLDFDVVMFETCFNISPAASRSFVALCKLLDARELDETESCAASDAFLQAGNQIRFDKLLDSSKALFCFTVDFDTVVEGIGAFNQNRDVVLGEFFGIVFNNRVAATSANESSDLLLSVLGFSEKG